jgi:iron complex outermembrane receptor protein
VLYRHTSGFFAGPTFDFIGSRYVDFANTYRVKSYELVGARAGWSAGQWEVFAEGRNLADKDYIATVVVKDRADAGMEVLYPGAPRSVYFGARYRF